MKRRIFSSWVLSAWIVLGCNDLLSAQTHININMPHNSGPTVVTLAAPPSADCFYTFSDNGGIQNTYTHQSGAGSVLTFWPSAPGNKVVVQFTSFHTEPGFDALFVYDGPDANAPQISAGTAALLGLPNPFSGGTGGWQGTAAPYNIAPGTVRATASNTSGALTFAFDTDLTVGKSGWTAIVSEVPGGLCSLVAPAALNVAAPADACAADVQTAPPAISPGACSQVLELRYRLNDGPAVTVPSPAPPFIALTGVPVGLNVVTWQLVAPCGGGIAASAVQLVTVADQAPPTVVVPTSVTIQLDPGKCATAHHYEVSAFDNCALPLATHRVEHPVDFNNGTAGILFDLINLSQEPLVITEFGPVLDPGTWPLEVYVTTTAISWQGVEHAPTEWTLAGVRSATSTSTDAGTPLSDFRITLAPGESRGVYIASAQGAPLRCTGVNSGVQRQYDDGTLRVFSAPGASIGYPFGETNISRAYNGYVGYATTHTQPEQISGLPSGADFPLGTTTNIFRCTDQAGNTATASFTVTVQPFSGASSTLICANMVNASLGPACATVLQADDILLGGPYRCFDTYQVQLDKIPPFNDGPWVSASLNSADIGKTYGVRVTDPVFNNFCMGMVLVEDKIPPVLTADVVDLPCNFNTVPTHNSLAPVVRTFVPANPLPASVMDFQMLQFDIPATAPTDAVVEDVDVQIKVNGDVFERNLHIELENPAGLKVTLWNQATGCTGPLWARFDDEGNNSADCGQFTGNLHARIPFNGGLLAAFEGGAVAGDWKLRVRDLNGFGDVATVTELALVVRYQASFSAGFPNGLTPGQLTQVTPNTFIAPAPLLDHCGDVTLSYSDEAVSLPCSTGFSTVISRTWTARDESNNTSTFVQTIRLMKPDFNDLTLPPHFNEIDAPAFDCGNPYPTPAWIESQGKQGAPYVFGRSTGCSIHWSYTDAVVNVCPGSYTINRNWLIVDACSAQSMQATQLIKVLDRQEPIMTCPNNLTVSTDLYNCCATVNLPDVIVEDACSPIAKSSGKIVVFNQYSGDTVQVANINGSLTTFTGNNTTDPDTLAAFGNTTCLPIGPHQVHYKIEDACGNAKSCSFQLSVRDYTPPVALGHSLTIVALNSDDPNDCYETSAGGAHFAGVTTVVASVFDQGSNDNCNFVRVSVRRVPPYSACIEALNDTNGGPPCQDAFPDLKSEYARATGESDSIKFYCCEAGTTQTLALRCYQLDGLGQYSLGPNGLPLFNETLVKVEVQDKLGPGCTAPADVTVSCENFDPALPNYGTPLLVDNCCLDTTKKYLNLPGLAHSLDFSAFDTLCNRGTLTRTFTVHDCRGQTSQCVQKIVVTQHLDFAIRFPDDVVVTACDSNGIYGEPVFHGQACELLAVSYKDEVFTVVSDACYEIERTWRVKDLCNSVPGGGCVAVPNPTPEANLGAPQNLTGPVVAPPGTPAPWAATVTKIAPNDAQATDYSTFWNASINCYEYKQIIRVLDKQVPLLENSSDTTVLMKDLTLNTKDLWNETYWHDNATNIQDLGEGPSELTVIATDLCSGASIGIRYLLFLDLDNDGDTETVVNSADLPGFNNVQFDNAANPNYTGGESRAFDERVVPNDERYGFALHTAVVGKKKIASVCWNTEQQPGNNVVPELPYGKHRVKWIISDGCGNETFREQAFEVVDDKEPTVVCHDGLSVSLMSTDMIEMWATDFLQYAQDNYTPPTPNTTTPNMLRFAVRKAGQGTGFPVNAQGQPVTSVTFTCDEQGPQEVELWAMDLAGNADFCKTTIDIQDNANHCDPNNNPTNITVAGTLKTELEDGIDNAKVNLQAMPPNSGTLIDLYQTTVAPLGGYSFLDVVPIGSNYTVVPALDDNPLNGVSTFDLVLISRHILGLQPLTSPYKMIAADANKSNSITTFDIVEIRKLILGIHNDLPGNTSWRFIDKDFVFPQATNPFATAFPETISKTDVQVSQLADDFVAIKIGDVNNTALTSAQAPVDDRVKGTLYFDVEDRSVEKGAVFTVHFKAAEVVLGWQFTMHLLGLEVVNIEEGEQVKASNFAVFADVPGQPRTGTLTTSVDLREPDAPVFTITFRALRSGRLSEMLGVSSRITRAEGYRGHYSNDLNDTPLDIAFRFHNGSGGTVSSVGFELYQNQPNPFASKTTVAFHLPAAADATLTVYDDMGRVLFVHKGHFPQGYNVVPLDASNEMNASDLMWYKLETATDAATRKMTRLR